MNILGILAQGVAAPAIPKSFDILIVAGGGGGGADGPGAGGGAGGCRAFRR